MGKVWNAISPFKAINEVIKEEERRAKTRRFIEDLKAKDFCSNCGKRTQVVCKNHSAWIGDCGTALCFDCVEKCKNCRKYFCSKHIYNHKCRLK
ncbi:MAG: hypothetical protein Q8N99_02455 [Nanoarchaeota archaeon]|nr:hypothetical protein [Nanoarchaeota archaeon]